MGPVLVYPCLFEHGQVEAMKPSFEVRGGRRKAKNKLTVVASYFQEVRFRALSTNSSCECF